MKEERLYIVGYMASGKTTFGKALAEKTGRKFVDLDEEIVRQEGRSIPEIMEHEGEEYFRRVESRILKTTAGLKNAVVACGGGTPCYRDNMEFMTLHGKTLWLLASPERMVERIMAAGDTRPLASNKSSDELRGFVENHLRSRQPYYCRAEWRFSGDRLETADEIDTSVEEFLKQYPL